ncbi:MAG: DUF192 domain-containing protein [bacterium]|nr:DUF192 domain-containing protein [bacterium]
MIKYLMIFLPIFIVILLGGLFLTIKKLKPDYEVLKIEILNPVTQLVKLRSEVEISDTALKRAKGLSGREGLAENQGMLFIFEKPGKPTFWMAGMNFPLDIIWINGNKIVDISKDVQPPKSGELPAIISPSVEADKVLELSAGAVKKFNIKINDEIKILN